MKKFYDTVNHTQIKKYFKKFINKTKKVFPNYYDVNAERIFYSYLNSYTFNKCVYPLNKKHSYFEDFHIINGKFEWVEKDLLNDNSAVIFDNSKYFVGYENYMGKSNFIKFFI